MRDEQHLRGDAELGHPVEQRAAPLGVEAVGGLVEEDEGTGAHHARQGELEGEPEQQLVAASLVGVGRDLLADVRRRDIHRVATRVDAERGDLARVRAELAVEREGVTPELGGGPVAERHLQLLEGLREGPEPGGQGPLLGPLGDLGAQPGPLALHLGRAPLQRGELGGRPLLDPALGLQRHARLDPGLLVGVLDPRHLGPQRDQPGLGRGRVGGGLGRGFEAEAEARIAVGPGGLARGQVARVRLGGRAHQAQRGLRLAAGGLLLRGGELRKLLCRSPGADDLAREGPAPLLRGLAPPVRRLDGGRTIGDPRVELGELPRPAGHLGGALLDVDQLPTRLAARALAGGQLGAPRQAAPEIPARLVERSPLLARRGDLGAEGLRLDLDRRELGLDLGAPRGHLGRRAEPGQAVGEPPLVLLAPPPPVARKLRRFRQRGRLLHQRRPRPGGARESPRRLLQRFPLGRGRRRPLAQRAHLGLTPRPLGLDPGELGFEHRQGGRVLLVLERHGPQLVVGDDRGGDPEDDVEPRIALEHRGDLALADVDRDLEGPLGEAEQLAQLQRQRLAVVLEVGAQHVALGLLAEEALLEGEVALDLGARSRRQDVDPLQPVVVSIAAGEYDLHAHAARARAHQLARRPEGREGAEEGVLDGVEQRGLAGVVLALDEGDPGAEVEGTVLVAAEVLQAERLDHGSSPPISVSAASSRMRLRSSSRASLLRAPVRVSLSSSSRRYCA